MSVRANDVAARRQTSKCWTASRKEPVEKASVSIEMAYRLSKAFGSTPETWLGMQLAFDLARSRHLQQEINVERIVAA